MFYAVLSIFMELMGFLWTRKLWFLIPLVGAIILLAGLMVVAEKSAVAPVIYTLF